MKTRLPKGSTQLGLVDVKQAVIPYNCHGKNGWQKNCWQHFNEKTLVNIELILLFLYQTLVDNKQHYFKSIFHRRLYLLDGLTKMVIVWYEVTYHQNATWRDWNVTFLIHIEHKTPKAFLDLGDQGLQRTIKSGRSVRSQYQKRTHTHTVPVCGLCQWEEWSATQ